MSLEGGSADELDAPWYGGHNGVEAFADCAGLAGEVNNEGVIANSGGLSAENGRGNFFE
ncbi:MAG: hypothetical protein RLZZ458_256 [Planctomycetota bacterium]